MSSACSNCGKHGHFFRECLEPITSLGIIAFRRRSEAVEWLMIRRRDSLGFIEIMRGKYELRDEVSIQSLINQTTLSERARLMTQDFLELWRDLWNGAASRRYLAEYEQAKAKFEVLKLGAAGRRSLSEYCAASTTEWVEPEWGFPKGRRSSTETDIGCALRETKEESGVPISVLHILTVSDVSGGHDSPRSTRYADPLIEEFVGSNGVSYRHRYWLAEAPSTLEVRLDPSNIDQSREIGDVRWCSTEEAIALIRPYNAEKRAVLVRATALV